MMPSKFYWSLLGAVALTPLVPAVAGDGAQPVGRDQAAEGRVVKTARQPAMQRHLEEKSGDPGNDQGDEADPEQR